MGELKLVHLFSGIGAPEEALKNIGVKFEIVHYAEIDKHASKSYAILNNISEEKNLGDVAKVDESKLCDFDLMFYGFPCQDVSIIGEQKGIIKNETRSGLLYEALRIARHKRPKYMIAENVKNLIGNRFINDFNNLLNELNNMGYNNYYQILNTKDYGLPQNRERVFIVSIRKDLKRGFDFPTKVKLTKTFRNCLEMRQPLDYNYYLTKDNIESYIFKEGDFAERFEIKNPYKELAYCLVAKGCKQVITNNYILDIHGVRGLTEREYCKLQGFKPSYIDLLKEKGISKNQIYKMLGNSISVPVLEGIFENLLLHQEQEKQLSFG